MAHSASLLGLSIDLYAVLGLPQPGGRISISPAQVKVAFRRSLLKYHPDKAAQLLGESTEKGQDGGGSQQGKYDVDTIILARDILLDPARRRDYDRDRLSNKLPSANPVAGLHPTELETLDLDDMRHDPTTDSWSRACRCGNSRAYEVSEEDLNVASADGDKEVLVGCGGCSLFVRIVFEEAVEG